MSSQNGPQFHQESRFYFDRGAIGNETPHLFDFWICECDTAVGPIHVMLTLAKPSVAVWNPMNHNVSARLKPFTLGSLPVGLIGIRDMQRQMKSAF